MFGYVRPVLNLLTDKERAAYQGAYCGLCHTMGKRFGWLARFTLNYDFTFLAILLMAGETAGRETCRRCPFHPFKKNTLCVQGEGMERAADESMVLTWHKISDDVADRGFLRGLPHRFLRFLYRGAYLKAAAACPEFDQHVRCGLDKLHQLEIENSPSLDRAADAFAGILSAAGKGVKKESLRDRAQEQLLYHLGRWIYLTDAWDDLEEDLKHGSYNPFDRRFNGKAAAETDYVEATLTHSVRLAESAANLMEMGEWAPIIDNVLYSGLPAVQKAVMSGQWKDLQRIREKRK